MKNHEFQSYALEPNNLAWATNQSEQYILHKFPGLIESQVGNHLISNHSAFIEFQRINDQNLTKYLQKFDVEQEIYEKRTLQELLEIFTYSFYAKFARSRMLDAIKITKNHTNYEDDSVSMEKEGDMTKNPERIFMRKDEIETLRKANNEFKQTLKTGIEKEVFQGMVEGLTDAQTAEICYIGKVIENADIRKIEYLRGLIEYRYLCFQAISKTYGTERLLKAFKNYQAKNFKYFGTKILTELPGDDALWKIVNAERKPRAKKTPVSIQKEPMDPVELLQLVKSYDPKARILPDTGWEKPLFESHLSFDGKWKAYRAVVYFNRWGYAYDHSNVQLIRTPQGEFISK